MELDMKTIGRRVRTARKAFGLTVENLAERVGVANESLAHIECGARRPSLTLLISIVENQHPASIPEEKHLPQISFLLICGRCFRKPNYIRLSQPLSDSVSLTGTSKGSTESYQSRQ